MRFLTLVKLICTYSIDFWKSNLSIARMVLSPRIHIQPETITLETRAESPLEMLMLANLITFTPGTLLLHIEPGRSCTIHVLNDAEQTRTAVRERLEKPLHDEN